ncbi:MAG: aminotransferase class IV [Anaerolineales bacterium]|nr:aminotransferase class IV [Anaerolineales bacterium]
MTIQAYQLTSSGRIPLGMSAASLDDMTRQLADGFYTTFSTLAQGTRVLGLKAHLRRLYQPAEEIGLRPPLSENELRGQIAALTRVNLPDESRVRVILTKDKGALYIGVQAFKPLPKEIYEEGVKVVSAEMTRHDPRIKDSGFISVSAEQRKLLSKDIFEVLLTKNGKVYEGMTSNFYVVRGEKIITARRGILLGVTRKIALKLARGQGLSVAYRPPILSENFDEAFLTSSSRGVVPIVSIDGKAVGRGAVGAWTKRLSLAYQAYVEERGEKIVDG